MEAADWRSMNHRVCGGRLCFPWGSVWRAVQMRSETGGVKEKELSEVLKCRGSERSCPLHWNATAEVIQQGVRGTDVSSCPFITVLWIALTKALLQTERLQSARQETGTTKNNTEAAFFKVKSKVISVSGDPSTSGQLRWRSPLHLAFSCLTFCE